MPESLTSIFINSLFRNFSEITEIDIFPSLQNLAALEIKFKSQNSRGHFAAGIGDGNSKERTNSGGIAQQNGFKLQQNHDGDVGFGSDENDDRK